MNNDDDDESKEDDVDNDDRQLGGVYGTWWSTQSGSNDGRRLTPTIKSIIGEACVFTTI